MFNWSYGFRGSESMMVEEWHHCKEGQLRAPSWSAGSRKHNENGASLPALTRSCLLILSKQFHQLETKFSNIEAIRINSHSGHHTQWLQQKLFQAPSWLVQILTLFAYSHACPIMTWLKCYKFRCSRAAEISQRRKERKTTRNRLIGCSQHPGLPLWVRS